MTQYFHLTIGPVQGFVAQARRSKDLWGGSFLLSWLSAVAIATVRQQHSDNQIMFPVPDEKFMQAVTGMLDAGPKQGGIPNRFKGLTAQVAADFPAKQVVALVKLAWEQLAELVWQHDMQPFFEQHPEFDQHLSRQIWDRQVAQIWEISWAITHDPNASDLLDRRKNWRSHFCLPEPGEKCMMMAGWQELSGVKYAKTRSRFWQKLRETMGAGESDLEPAEQLCALGLIKRRFARYFSLFTLDAPSWGKGAGTNVPPPSLKGWSFVNDTNNTLDYDPTHVPSLPYMAAIPFMRSAYTKISASPQLTSSYLKFAEESKSQLKLPSRLVQFNGITELQQNSQLPSWVNHLDGISFYPGSLLAGTNYSEQSTHKLVTSLKRFGQQAGLTAASPFYALLLMDGDSLGKQMSDPKKQQGISLALNNFTQAVPSLVQQHDGFLVYAGGDDVLALLPIDQAIQCARTLALNYQQCFKQQQGNTDLFSTLSGAIQFAHYRTPLMKIVSEAHQLLDEVAKDNTGRDALAIRINKPQGVHAQWAMPWQAIYSEDDDVNVLEAAVRLFSTKQNAVTHKLLFKLLDVLRPYADCGASDEQILHLTKAEYYHSGKQLDLSNRELQQDLSQIAVLLAVCNRYLRCLPDNSATATIERLGKLQLDGIKLVRFIATKGLDAQEVHA